MEEKPTIRDVHKNSGYLVIVDFCKKLLEKILYSCELSNLENDLRKVFDEVQGECVSEISENPRAVASRPENADVLVVIFKHISNSQKYATFKETGKCEELFRQLAIFVGMTVRENVFCMENFLEAIRSFVLTEASLMDKTLANSRKTVMEALNSSLKEKLVLSFHAVAIVRAILSSKELLNDFSDRNEVDRLPKGMIEIAIGLAKMLKFPEHGDYKDVCLLETDQMRTYSHIAFNCLVSINQLVQWVENSNGKGDDVSIHKISKHLLRNLITELSFVMLQHIGKHAWTTTETRVEAQNLLNLLCKLTHCQNVRILLSGMHETFNSEMEERNVRLIFPRGISGLLLKDVQSKFANNGWKRDPTLVHIVAYIVTNIKFPDLQPHIGLLVPMLVELTEDYQSENQVLGIECLRHMVENVTASELNLYNHAAFIYQVFFKLLYGAKPPTLRVLLPCLQKILFVLEPFPERLHTQATSKWSETFLKLLNNLEYENNADLRETLAANIPGFINAIGVNSARYLLIILRTLSSCMEMYDNQNGAIRQHGLDGLRAVVTTCWPLMCRFAGAIIKIIIKVIIDISVEGTFVKEEAKLSIKQKSEEVLLLLSHCCGSKFIADYIGNASKGITGDQLKGVKGFLDNAKRDIESSQP